MPINHGAASSPDGRRFYFTLSERESDIWQMTIDRPS